MKHLVYGVGVLLLTFGQSSIFAQQNLSNTPGALHNEGVQFVLHNIETIPSPSEIGPLVVRLTEEFCASVRLDCSSISLPTVPPTTEQILATIKGSQEFKDDLGLMFRLIDNIRSSPTVAGLSLQQYEISLTDLETTVAGNLAKNERTEFLGVVSIARLSALLWAPVEEGGLNGVHFLNTPPNAEIASVNWGKVVIADVIGFLRGAKGGLLSGLVNGIAASLANLLSQLLAVHPPPIIN